MRASSLNIDADGQDDGREALPAELLLDGEGRLVMEDAVDDPGPAEDGLPGEDGRFRKFPGDGLAQGRARRHDVDACILTRLGREAQPAGQVDVFLERFFVRHDQMADGFRSLESSDVDLGHGDEDEVLVEAGKAADGGQEWVAAKAGE